MKILGVDPRKCWNPSKLFQKEAEKPVPRPTSRDQVIDWFKKTQKPRRVIYQKDNTIFPWFHGLISRAEAEELLGGDDAEVGAYLVRLSDKVFGYTISYKDEERIKHFLIDASKAKKVKFDGSAEKTHKDLAALVEYHQTAPISPAGEVLKHPKGQSDEDKTDYSDLMSD